MINRRGLITGLISLIAAPAIVRAGSLMPVKAMKLILPTLNVGDIVTFGGIKSIDRYTGLPMNELQQFVVTAKCLGEPLSIYPKVDESYCDIILDNDWKARLVKVDNYDHT